MSRSQVQNRPRKDVKSWNLFAQGAGKHKSLCLKAPEALLSDQLELDKNPQTHNLNESFQPHTPSGGEELCPKHSS